MSSRTMRIYEWRKTIITSWRPTCRCCFSAWPLLCDNQTACRSHRCCRRWASPQSERFPAQSWYLFRMCKKMTKQIILKLKAISLNYCFVQFLWYMKREVRGSKVGVKFIKMLNQLMNWYNLLIGGKIHVGHENQWLKITNWRSMIFGLAWTKKVLTLTLGLQHSQYAMEATTMWNVRVVKQQSYSHTSTYLSLRPSLPSVLNKYCM